jgi:tRNA U34 5-methylaminomethyl-2-thiouridine-forming methyltransferase MnmC
LKKKRTTIEFQAFTAYSQPPDHKIRRLFHTMTNQLIQTEDGSHSLKNLILNETYHSIHGAIQESTHIFINSGLKMCAKDKINILEIGFGTGLNAFLTLLESEKRTQKISYTTLELYPLTKEDWSKLNYPDILAKDKKELFYNLHSCSWNQIHQLNQLFHFNKIHADFTDYQLTNTYDLIFFDAFSPDKQPELWTEDRFLEIFNHCNNGATLTTYCAKGSVKRAMQFAGFEVEKLAGPPGKRHILRGTKKL